MADTKTYVLHLRTACGARQTREFHELPRRYVIPLKYPLRAAGNFLSEAPFMHVPKMETRTFELDEFMRDGDGEVWGGAYVEIES